MRSKQPGKVSVVLAGVLLIGTGILTSLRRSGVELPDQALTAAVIVLAIVAAAYFNVVFREGKSKKNHTLRRERKQTGIENLGRVSTAVQRLDPRSKSFTKPETYCAVHDHSGEDHLAHDKAQRIRQLDEWLKNGLIDRNEYRVLKSRYERDL